MTKVISLSDDAYEELKRLKIGNESFSEVVRRISKKENKKSLLDLAGVWKGRDDIKKSFETVAKDRKKPFLRDY